jgi:hypothetical protein
MIDGLAIVYLNEGISACNGLSVHFFSMFCQKSTALQVLFSCPKAGFNKSCLLITVYLKKAVG